MHPRFPLGDADTQVIEVNTEVIDMGGGPPPGQDPPATGEEPPRPRRRRRWRRTLLIIALVLGLLGGGGLVAAGLYVRSVNSDIKRIDAFDEVPEESRPEKVSTAK